MRKISILGLIIYILPIGLFAEENKSSVVQFNANYISDFGRNFYGGIQKGNFYMGMINLSMAIPTFKNSEFYFQIQNTHGTTPSQNLVGDLQRFSNIENGDFTYLYMAYYKQTLGKFSAIFGIHDLNSEFYVTRFGKLFLNSSFGIQPSVSMNMPISIFPKNAPGLVLQYKASDWLTIQTSAYDGDPGTLDDDPYNTKLSVDFKRQGIFSSTEIHLHQNSKESISGTYKLGFQYHSAMFLNFNDSTLKRGNYGLYFIADQYLKKNMGVFSQLGWSPSTTNINPLYAGAGMNIFGFGKRTNDVFGMAFSYVQLSRYYCKNYSVEKINYESAIELSYCFQVSDNLSIQPDIQYILSKGALANSSEALVQSIRVNINL